MYVIREKLSKKVLYIDYSLSIEHVGGDEIFPDFDSETMEIGWTDNRYIPAHFNINDPGKIEKLTLEQQIAEDLYPLDPYHKFVNKEIVPKTIEELVEEGILSLEEIKHCLIQDLSLSTLRRRRELIPDYKLINASLCIYDEREISDLRATIESFRNEFHRIKSMINEAKNLLDIRAIQNRSTRSV